MLSSTRIPALELQGAYEDLYQWQIELQGKYDEQSKLLKEVSAAIKAADAEAKQRHQALLDAQHNKQQEFDQAIQGAVQQYKVQLNTAQSKLQARDWEHQLMIKQLQDKISMLEVTSASQANLPSVATSNPQEVHVVCIVKSLTMSQVLLTPKGGLPSMTAKTKHSHFPISKSGSRMGVVVLIWISHLWLVKVHSHQLHIMLQMQH